MVKLQLASKIDAKEYPFTHNWDVEMRRNHETYQERIDKQTYNLQRNQRSWFFLGEWLYPAFYQKDLLNLELL